MMKPETFRLCSNTGRCESIARRFVKACAEKSILQFALVHHVGNLEPPIDLDAAVYLCEESDLFAAGIDERFFIRHPEKNEARAETVLTRRYIFFKKELLAVASLEIGRVLERANGGAVERLHHCISGSLISRFVGHRDNDGAFRFHFGKIVHPGDGIRGWLCSLSKFH